MPTFTPNDYFWKHHWDSSKEEKWEAYARAVREIMCDYGGLKVSEHDIRDKINYENLVAKRIKRGEEKPTRAHPVVQSSEDTPLSDSKKT